MTLHNNLTEPHRHHDDVERIQRVLRQNGYHVDYDTAIRMWTDYSDRYSSGWVLLPETDEDLWNELNIIRSNLSSYASVTPNDFVELANWLVSNRFTVFIDADISKDSKKRILNQLGYSSAPLGD